MLEENKNFITFLNSLTPQERRRTCREIRKACDVTPVSIWRWCQGSNQITSIYKKEINRVTNRELFKV